MPERMTYRRVKQLSDWAAIMPRDNAARPVFMELLQALKAERQEVDRLNSPVLKSEWQELERKLARVRGLLRVAKCPACDGSGAIPDGVHGCYQCQWCDERNQATGEGK